MTTEAAAQKELVLNFPFLPYEQQTQLMTALFECLENSGVGCFESPTGTGKSLSVAVAALTWLEREEKKLNEIVRPQAKRSDDWLSDMMNSCDSQKAAHGEKIRNFYSSLRLNLERSVGGREIVVRPKFAGESSKIAAQRSFSTPQEDHEEFLLQENTNSNVTAGDRKRTLTMQQSKGEQGGDAFIDEDSLEDMNELLDSIPQIFYCSRTHSQLSQFVSEIQKAKFRSVRVVTLGSRRSYCINEAVCNLKNDSAMSERCLDMQKSSSSNCSFHRRLDEESFAYNLLADTRDIEETIALSKQRSVCGYYGSRQAVRYAQIVCLPYNMMLSAEMRHSMGLRLKGRVVVFDEAHNLVDAVNQLHSESVAVAQLREARKAVQEYLKKFEFRLSAQNLCHVNIVCNAIECLMRSIESHRRSTETSIAMTVNEFVGSSGLDRINLFALLNHIKQTNFSNKLIGFCEHQRKKVAPIVSKAKIEISYEDETKHSGECADFSPQIGQSIRKLIKFLKCLCFADKSGRIIVTAKPSSALDEVSCGGSDLACNGTISYILLDASSPFQRIVDEAKSVILLGGTLQPSYLRSQLFPGLQSTRWRKFSCGHVVAPNRVIAVALGRGPHGTELELTQSKKFMPTLIEELADAVLMALKAIPKGVILFFTSYSYLDCCISSWRRSGAWDRLAQQKTMFVEPRAAAEVDALWGRYSAAVKRNETIVGERNAGGALLCCVVGGKLSEGINFSDDLARGVIVLGMPYPDPRDAVLKMKMDFANEHLDRLHPSHSTKTATGSISMTAGNALYDSICMNAINQSIGRSIRHAKDFAAILLVDARYSRPQVLHQLPVWLQDRVVVASTTCSARDHITQFFEQDFQSQ